MGRRDMFLRCTGTGRPTVVLEAGGGLDSADWGAVQRRADDVARVCSYDRAGQGRSDDPREEERDVASEPAAIAEQLHTLLDAAGVAPPFVLVGHSLGGLYVIRYELAYPDEVVGMVLVDAVRPTSGVAPGSFGDVPLVVLTQSLAAIERTRDPWLDDQRKLARLSSNSVLVSARRSDHFIERRQPKLVAEAIRQAVKAAREGRRLPACDDVFPRAGGECLRE